MNFLPITERNTNELLEKIRSFGFPKFSLNLYENAHEREEDVPYIELYEAEELYNAFYDFMYNCPQCLSIELRGIDAAGKEMALCIGGTDKDVSTDGEYIADNIGILNNTPKEGNATNDVLIATCPECGKCFFKKNKEADFACQKCGATCESGALGLKSVSDFGGGEKVHFSVSCDLSAEQDAILRAIFAQWGIGLSVFNADKALVAVTLVRNRLEEGEQFVSNLFLLVDGAELLEASSSGTAAADAYVEQVLRTRIQQWLTTQEGWSANCDASLDFNWGDFAIQLPLPAFDIYLDVNDVFGYKVSTFVDISVAQDERLAPTKVPGMWVLSRDGIEIARQSVTIDFHYGSLDLPNKMTDMLSTDTCVVQLQNGTVLPCDPEEEFERLKIN